MKSFFLILILTFFGNFVSGFCFYNHSDAEFYIKQKITNATRIWLNRFKAGPLRNGDKACCNYQDIQCVLNQRKDAIAWFEVESDSLGLNWQYIRYAMSVPSGGWMEFHGPKDDVEVRAYWADGTEYDFVQDREDAVVTE